MGEPDIELTDDWIELLFRHCLSSHYQLHKVAANDVTFSFLEPLKPRLWRRLRSVCNYYVTQTGPSPAPSTQQATQLAQQLFDRKWHIAEWGPTDLEQPFAVQLRHTIQALQLPELIQPTFVNWQLRRELITGDYFASLPSRLKSTLHRKKRKLEQSKHAWHCELLTTPEQCKRYFDDYIEIYNKSWKPTEEHIQFIRQFCQRAAQKGWLRLGILRIDNKAVAAQIWFVFNEKASIFKLAYQQDYRHYSPGTILTEFLMRHVLEIDQVNLVDFGMGDEPYKADWMNFKNTRYTITTFNTHTLLGKLAQLRFQTLPQLKKRFLSHDKFS